jgi:hypothetical protein
MAPCYITNNGGFDFHAVGGLNIPGNAPADYTTGRIERVDLNTGKVERLYDKVDNGKLSAVPTTSSSIKPATSGSPISARTMPAQKTAVDSSIASQMAH